MTDAHCHVSGGDPSVRELLVGRDFVGVHPWDVEKWRGGEVEKWLRGRLCADPRLGVGEIGLDRLKAKAIPPQMRELFAAQLRVALEFGRPVVLHGAKCWGEVVREIREIIELSNSRLGPFLFHGFSRSGGLLPEIVALNGYVSVGPAVLNDHAVNYRALVKEIPLDRLLVETDRDCPPEARLNPLTGRPLVVRDVLEKTAAVRGVGAAELEAATDANAARFLGAVMRLNFPKDQTCHVQSFIAKHEAELLANWESLNSENGT